MKFLQICVQDNETSCGNDEINDWSYENECRSSWVIPQKAGTNCYVRGIHHISLFENKKEEIWNVLFFVKNEQVNLTFDLSYVEKISSYMFGTTHTTDDADLSYIMAKPDHVSKHCYVLENKLTLVHNLWKNSWIRDPRCKQEYLVSQ